MSEPTTVPVPRRRSAPTTTKLDRAVSWLRRRVASGEWPLDSRVPAEPELAETIGVGRSTVREATRTLAAEGMLEVLPGIGTFVRSRSPVEPPLARLLARHPVEEVLLLRRSLEVEAAGLAALSRDDEDLAGLRAALTRPLGVLGTRAPGDFHARLLAAARTPLLAELHGTVVAALRQARSTGTLVGLDDDEIRADHARILVAVEARDAASARAEAAAHADRDLRPAAG